MLLGSSARPSEGPQDAGKWDQVAGADTGYAWSDKIPYAAP